jgi:hypothetical protein
MALAKSTAAPATVYSHNDCQPDTCLVLRNDGAEGFIHGCSMLVALRSQIPSLNRQKLLKAIGVYYAKTISHCTGGSFECYRFEC